MKLTIKQLQGIEFCLEVAPTDSILVIKKQIGKKLNVAVTSQKLLYLGKPLADEKTISSYPSIKEGTKLNLAVKQPETLYDITLKQFKKMGLSDAQASKAAGRLQTVMKEKINLMSWDDIDKLSSDFLLLKDGKRPIQVERDSKEDPNYF